MLSSFLPGLDFASQSDHRFAPSTQSVIRSPIPHRLHWSIAVRLTTQTPLPWTVDRSVHRGSFDPTHFAARSFDPSFPASHDRPSHPRGQIAFLLHPPDLPTHPLLRLHWIREFSRSPLRQPHRLFAWNPSGIAGPHRQPPLLPSSPHPPSNFLAILHQRVHSTPLSLDPPNPGLPRVGDSGRSSIRHRWETDFAAGCVRESGQWHLRHCYHHWQPALDLILNLRPAHPPKLAAPPFLFGQSYSLHLHPARDSPDPTLIRPIDFPPLPGIHRRQFPDQPLLAALSSNLSLHFHRHPFPNPTHRRPLHHRQFDFPPLPRLIQRPDHHPARLRCLGYPVHLRLPLHRLQPNLAGHFLGYRSFQMLGSLRFRRSLPRERQHESGNSRFLSNWVQPHAYLLLADYLPLLPSRRAYRPPSALSDSVEAHR